MAIGRPRFIIFLLGVTSPLLTPTVTWRSAGATAALYRDDAGSENSFPSWSRRRVVEGACYLRRRPTARNALQTMCRSRRRAPRRSCVTRWNPRSGSGAALRPPTIRDCGCVMRASIHNTGFGKAGERRRVGSVGSLIGGDDDDDWRRG